MGSDKRKGSFIEDVENKLIIHLNKPPVLLAPGSLNNRFERKQLLLSRNLFDSRNLGSRKKCTFSDCDREFTSHGNYTKLKTRNAITFTVAYRIVS